MENLLDYVVNGDGWVAGHRRKKGDTVSLTKAAAKYENVTLKSETAAKVEPNAGAKKAGTRRSRAK